MENIWSESSFLRAGRVMDGAAARFTGAAAGRLPEDTAGWHLGRDAWTEAVKERGFVERTGHAVPDRMPRIDALRDGRYCR